MKDLIMICGIIILLLVFPMQYAIEQTNHHNMATMQTYVYTAKEKAKVEGRFTEANINELKTNISNTFKDISIAEITVDVTTSTVYRTNEFDERELIHYKVSVPIKKLIAAHRLWGISDSDNTLLYTIEGNVTSEKI